MTNIRKSIALQQAAGHTAIVKLKIADVEALLKKSDCYDIMMGVLDMLKRAT